MALEQPAATTARCCSRRRRCLQRPAAGGESGHDQEGEALGRRGTAFASPRDTHFGTWSDHLAFRGGSLFPIQQDAGNAVKKRLLVGYLGWWVVVRPAGATVPACVATTGQRGGRGGDRGGASRIVRGVAAGVNRRMTQASRLRVRCVMMNVKTAARVKYLIPFSSVNTAP